MHSIARDLREHSSYIRKELKVSNLAKMIGPGKGSILFCTSTLLWVHLYGYQCKGEIIITRTGMAPRQSRTGLQGRREDLSVPTTA